MGIYESDYSDSMLSVAFDTYGTDSGVRVLYNGVSIASTTSADPLSFDTIGIALDETGQLTVSEGETQIFDIITPAIKITKLLHIGLSDD